MLNVHTQKHLEKIGKCKLDLKCYSSHCWRTTDFAGSDIQESTASLVWHLEERSGEIILLKHQRVGIDSLCRDDPTHNICNIVITTLFKP